MKFRCLSISSKLNNKVSRRSRIALGIGTLGILLSFFLPHIIHIDNIYAQINSLNTEKIFTPIIPFLIDMPFVAAEQEAPGSKPTASTSEFSSLAVCNKLPISAITASSSLSSSPPSFAIYGNFNTRWSFTSARTSWIQADLGSVKTVCYAAIAWYPQTEKYSFSISVSPDGVNFRNVLSSQNSGTTQYPPYDFPDAAARYVRTTVVRSGELDLGQT
jgi:hypothetical protein